MPPMCITWVISWLWYDTSLFLGTTLSRQQCALGARLKSRCFSSCSAVKAIRLCVSLTTYTPGVTLSYACLTTCATGLFACKLSLECRILFVQVCVATGRTIKDVAIATRCRTCRHCTAAVQHSAMCALCHTPLTTAGKGISAAQSSPSLAAVREEDED